MFTVLKLKNPKVTKLRINQTLKQSKMKTLRNIITAFFAVFTFASCSKSIDAPTSAKGPIIKTFTVGQDSTITISVGVYNGYILGMVKTSFAVTQGYKTTVKITDDFKNSQSFEVEYSFYDHNQGHFTEENYLYGLPTDLTITK